MKAIIMAAGKGTRISRYINNKPKCTVNIGKETLIENTIKKLKQNGVNDIAIVLGYKHEIIENILDSANVRFYYNPFFDVTNSIVSLWFAQDFLQNDDFIIMNGDVFCENDIFKQILTEKDNRPILYSDESKKEEADYKLFYTNNILLKYGKDLTGNDITGEYIGIAKICNQFLPLMKSRLNDLINNQQHMLWWENVLYSYSNDIDIVVHDTNNKFWAEVDYVEDYEKIKDFIKTTRK